MDTLTRRDWLQAGALLTSVPCACAAGASSACCTVPAAPPGSVRFEPGLLCVDLERAPELRRVGSYIKFVDESRKLQILIARPEKDRFVALDQKCTHGGGALTYVHARKHLYCTCWGHSKFALDGRVIRWPNRNTPRPLRAYAVELKGSLLEIRIEGLV